MYGAIIYNKAPIMMRQLELLVGEEKFREGMQEYLVNYSFENATWPDLIRILDQKSDWNLTEWSEVWVNTPGRPHFSMETNNDGQYQIVQEDPLGDDRTWPQTFTVLEYTGTDSVHHSLTIDDKKNSFQL